LLDLETLDGLLLKSGFGIDVHPESTRYVFIIWVRCRGLDLSGFKFWVGECSVVVNVITAKYIFIAITQQFVINIKVFRRKQF
jgi:hypothetical protein